MMQEVFDALGAGVDFAANGEDGCSLIDQNPEKNGLVLMDIHMPKMSGVDVTKVVRSNPNNPPRDVRVHL